MLIAQRLLQIYTHSFFAKMSVLRYFECVPDRKFFGSRSTKILNKLCKALYGMRSYNMGGCYYCDNGRTYLSLPSTSSSSSSSFEVPYL